MIDDPVLQAVHAYSRGKMSDDETGHGFDHILRVVRMTEHLLAAYPEADQRVAVTAAYLHDVIDEKLVPDVAAAREDVRQFLDRQAVSPAQIQAIFLIIDNLSFHKTLEGTAVALPLEGQLVQDADRLDAIGAIGIARAVYFGGHYGERLYDPAVAPRTNMTHADYRDLDQETIINHFDEKLLKLKALMNTAAAKRVAEHRQQVMLAFLEEFKAEWSAEK